MERETNEMFKMYIKKIDEYFSEVGVVAGGEFKTVAVVPVDYKTACAVLAKAFFDALKNLTGIVFQGVESSEDEGVMKNDNK